MTFKIELQKNDQGGYQAVVPRFPGCIGSGKTEEETLARVQSKIFLNLGVEFVPPAKARKGFGYYKSLLSHFMVADMSQERKFAALTTMTGLLLMTVTIWGAGLLLG